MSSDPTHAPSSTFRSLLSVPANQPKFFDKAAGSAADAIMLDLEDAVFAEQKLSARETLRGALETVDWGSKTVLVRVNAVDTEWGFRDIITLGSACARLDGIMLPKLETADELSYVERLLESLNAERADGRVLQLHVLIETAKGVAHVERILEAARRLASVTFGAGDYAISLGLYGGARAAGNADYVVLAGERGAADRQAHWNDSHHYAMSRIANACHAIGVVPIDGPYGDFSDAAAAEVSTRRAKALGYLGKWAIHPSMLEMINRTFKPSGAELIWARKVAVALADARAAGLGAAQLDGRLIEAATMKTVDRILRAAGEA